MSKAVKNIANSQDYKQFYQSTNTQDVQKAIDSLVASGTIDDSRELIYLFSNCVWRETKFSILKALGTFKNSRALEFLFHTANDETDLPLASAAIESLASTDSSMAARFLENLYLHGHSSKKPVLVLSLANLAHRTVAPQLLKDLESALEQNEVLLSKNLLFALGELKYLSAKPFIIQMLKKRHLKEIEMSALVCLGKLSRDLNDFSDFENHFKNDSFEMEILKQVKNQVHFRSQWKLEDYLVKLFESTQTHKNMAFELNAFEEADVLAGLQMFAEPKNYLKLSHILSKLSFSSVGKWYSELIKFDDVSTEEASLIYNSLSHHNFKSAQEIPNIPSKNESDYIQCVLMSGKNSYNFFSDYLQTNQYTQSTNEEKIQFINHIAEFALINIPNDKVNSQLSLICETELSNETQSVIKARWIRLAAQIKKSNNKLFSLIKNYLRQPEFDLSVLFFLEKNPTYQGVAFLNSYLGQNTSYNEKTEIALLRSMAAQEKNQFEYEKVKSFLLKKLDLKSPSEEALVSALKFLQKNPFKEFKLVLVGLLAHSSTEVQLHAIVALRNYDSEELANLVAPFLKSTNDSIRGRALDTLLQQSSLRSKRLAIDFLEDHLKDNSTTERVLRSLLQSQLKSEYFLQKIEKFMTDHPHHVHFEEMTELKQKIQGELSENSPKKMPSAEELLVIDKHLTKELPKYHEYDEAVKVSLRSAEMPFANPELYDQFVDASSCILGYSKAVDIFMEKYLGKKQLYTKVEAKLHEFQNVIHLCSLNEDYPPAEKVLKVLSLEKAFTPQSLPLHKMTLIAKGLLSSKIVHESFKVIDGLRAWSIVLLIYARKTPSIPKPLIQLNLDEAQIIWLSKKLMWLQDLRNPVAHRQTVVHMGELTETRKEIYKILALLEKTLM